MNDKPDPALVARAKDAVARALGDQEPAKIEPPDPETLARLGRAMLALPWTTREIFLAHRLDGQSYAEIAGITGLSVKQVRRHMAKAIYQLSQYADGDERTGWQRFWQSHSPRWFR